MIKRTALSMILASTLALSACQEDEKNKANASKAAPAEQNVAQLKADLEKAQAELKETQQKLEKAQSGIPSLIVKEVEILEEKEEFTREKPADAKEDDYFLLESSLEFNVNAVETDYPWINDLLYGEMIDDIEEDGDAVDGAETKKAQKAKDPNASPKEQFIAQVKDHYEYALDQTKNFETFGYEYYESMSYSGQRNYILSFAHSAYIFSGGAHGMNWTNYINIDAEKKSIIRLNDLVEPKKQDVLKSLLWAHYVDRKREQGIEDEAEYDTQFDDLTISEQFYFTSDGISFVYPPYAIGTYAEGEITLTVNWDEVKNIVTPNYMWWE
ncbi:hypothetical protein A4G18_09145 [Pasteurellaceae bacterium Pebbles2]|nr:hypothetical protein [Pasteurellaceae bacterium Pebbles2]